MTHWRLFLFLQIVALSGAPAFSQTSDPLLSRGLATELSQAENLYQGREFDQAIKICLAALKKPHINQDPFNFVAAHNILGICYIYTRSYDEALQALEAGLRRGKELLPKGHHLFGDAHYNLGVYYDRLGHAEESMTHHRQALRILTEAFGNNHIKTSECFIGLGELYLYTIQDFKKANHYFQRAARIREQHLKNTDLDLYIAYYYLAQVNRRIGDHDKALIYAFKALSVIRTKDEYRSYLERCYTLLGDIYYSQTKFDKAIEYLEAGIEQSIVSDGLANYNLIKKYINLGVTFGEMKEPVKAISCFRKSLAIHSRHHHHNMQLQAENFLHLGRTFQNMGVMDSAMFYVKAFLKVQRSEFGDHHIKTSRAYGHLARLLAVSNELDSAALYSQKAIVVAFKNFKNVDIFTNPGLRSVADHPELFELFGDKGSILLKLYLARPKNMKTLSVALECFSIADTLMLLSRNTYQQEGSKLFFADHYHSIYEKALQSAYLLFLETQDTKYAAQALSFMEKSKAFLLTESLNKAEIFTQAGLPDSIRDMERKFITAIAAYRSQLEDPHHKISEQIQLRIQTQIFDITQKQERLLDTISRLYPNYYQVKYQRLSSLSDIQSFAKKNNATIIEYFWGEKKIYALAISGKGLAFREVAHVDSLTQSIVHYFESLRQLPSWKENDVSFQNFFTNSYQIYNTLVAPLLENDNNEKIIIIRDGPLLHIPFESLPVSTENINGNNYQELDYLIRHHTVSYAHSADLLLKSSARIKPGSGENKVLGFSYSQLNSTEHALAGNRAVNELPGAAREIEAISKVLPGSYFLGEEATEDKFKSQAGNFDILHLAVHGKSDPEKQFSGSLFFKQTQDQVDDGELHVYELYDLSLKARLAVLSSCESGVGKFFRGEGVFSIARGFAYAGCPATVMSLWPVSDMTSARIMADFYNELSEGENIDVALREAKLRYLETADPQLSHPAYWSAFIPTGNMDAVVAPGQQTEFIALIILLSLGVTGIFIFKRGYLPKK